MGRKTGRTCSAQLKFQVVMECLKSDASDAEVARAYDVHPVTVAKWKKQFEEHGPEVFGGKEEVRRAEGKIEQLERMLGQKEVEIALLRNFLKGR